MDGGREGGIDGLPDLLPICYHLLMSCIPCLSIYLSICLQVNAYLQQRLGFNNTARLQGGIVSYARELQRINNGDDRDDIGGGGGGGGYDDSGDDGNTRSGDRLDQQNDGVELEIIEPHQVVVGDASIYPRSDRDKDSSSSSSSSSSSGGGGSSSYSKNVGVIIDTGDNKGNDSRSIERSKSVVTGPRPPHGHHRTMFRGVNYVFDERIGSRVTEDVLRRCEQCDGVSDNYNNCLNYDCNVSYTKLS